MHVLESVGVESILGSGSFANTEPGCKVGTCILGIVRGRVHTSVGEGWF
jgi:hypothetical protein